MQKNTVFSFICSLFFDILAITDSMCRSSPKARSARSNQRAWCGEYERSAPEKSPSKNTQYMRMDYYKSAFVQWQSSESPTSHDRLLFISGKSGCGKSVLASSIIEMLQEQGKQTTFFYFSNLESKQQTVDGLVRCLLHDALTSAADEEMRNTIQSQLLNGQPTVFDLWETFNEFTSPFFRRQA